MVTELIDGYRLSPQQRRVWKLQQLDGGSYRTVAGVLVEGLVQPRRLQSALGEVLARHEILRTDFRYIPGMSFPLQVVNPQANPEITFQDLAGLDPVERSVYLDQLFRQMMHQPFACKKGTPLQASLASVSQMRHVLFLGLPALCADQASLENLAREIARFYNGSSGQAEMRDEPVQYSEASEVFLDFLESEETEAGRDYWRRQNLPDLRALKLPLEGQPGPGATFTPVVLNFKLGGGTMSHVERVTRACGTSVVVFLLACWHVLLWRLTGQSDMLVGVAADGRTHEALTDALGLFERYLPVRCLLGHTMPFEDVLEQLEKTTSEALSRQDYFDWGQIGFDAGDSKLPLCPFMLDFDAPARTNSAAGITLRIVRQYSCSDRFCLKLSARPQDDDLALSLHYDASLYNRRHAAALARHYLTLLSSAVDSPATPAGSLNLLGPRQRHRLLRHSRHPRPAAPLVAPFHQLFGAQASRTPDAIAVRDEEGQVSYDALNLRSNQLAHYLRRRGVRPERVVALYLPRSQRLVEAVLGVLKAGGAYLPLDTGSPAERLRLMVEDAGAVMVLAETGREAELENVGAAVVGLEVERERIARESAEQVEGGADEQNLAYVIYTSGSTGRPKGVMVEHRGLSHYLSWVLSEYPAGEGRGAPAHSPVAFDLTVTSMLAPLAAGSRVVLVGEGPGASRLVELLQQEDDFGLIKLTPAHLEALEVGLTAPGLAGKARALVVGGEALRWHTVRACREGAPETRIINEYGPTEAVVGCCTYEISDSVGQIDYRCAAEGEMVPIGRAIAGATIYVVDAGGWLMPEWSWGELWIGGRGLARGYSGEPRLTAERFIPNPFTAKPGTRCYRTGDIGRWGTAGQLDYGGRADRQVKVRGYRVELGEIEAVVGLHANVREAIVIAREEVSGEARLVCYVTPKPSHELRVAELRNYLQSKLPDYMVPSAFVTLSSFPLTANGKVDRRALPAPEASRNSTATEIIAPRTPVERLLAKVWADVLGLDLSDLSISDNFFELGGDSILAIKVVARANAAGLSLASGQLFRHQTIAELGAAAGTSTVVRAQQDTVTGAIPLTPIQHWFFENSLPNPHHFNQSLMVEVRQKLDPKLVEEAVRRLIAHHDVLRLRFTRNGAEWKQHTESHMTAVPFKRVDVSGAGDELSSAIEVAATEAQASLNISDGPLMRVVLFDAGEGEPARLLIVIHHLAIDIVSWGAVLEDFHQAYAQLSRGESVRLPVKTTSYKDWAERLQTYAHSEELRREAEHWLTPSYHSASRLPVDYPDAINNVASARTLRVWLDEDETGALLREIPRTRRAQIHEVLLAALGQALAWWTGDSVALVNIEGHGREEVFDVNLSRTVGWFTAIYPLLIDVSGVADPEQTLRVVMNQLRRTPNGGLGYGVLRYLGDEEIRTKLTSRPQPEVIFNYQGQAHQRRPVSSQFRVARESSGPDAGALGKRRHLLDVNAGVANECLNVHWTYSENMHRRSTIEKLAKVFIEALRDLIAHCRLDQSVVPTVPDFAQAGLDERTLQNIMARIKFD